jgi:origin recognition complex subunit 1
MDRAEQSAGDDVFLLPYACSPRYSLSEPVSLSDHDEDEAERFFRALAMEASPEAGEAKSNNGGKRGVPLHRYRVLLRDFVLLRPPSNASPPFVCRIVKFFSQKRDPLAPRARVQWFYRPSDLLIEKPHRAYGEDEVLETPHFSDINADTIVGRCTVTDYQSYVKLVSKPLNILAKPIFEDPSSHGGPAEDDDDAMSTDSIFADNYASSSTRLFCRDYYDACADAVATSAFDDPDADPAIDIADRDGADFESDNSARHADLEHSSSSDGSISDPEVELKESDLSAKKRRRGRIPGSSGASRSKAKADERKHHSVFQFCLPAEIGIGEELPCRDAEKAQVWTFLETAIRESVEGKHGGDRCLYISGVPGTGKTATVREVIGRFQQLMNDGSMPSFSVVEVNGMSLPDPNLVYSELYAAVVGQRGVAPSRAAQLLEKRFDSNTYRQSSGAIDSARTGAAQARERGRCVILILDEMDVLVSRKQQLLYDLLEWPTRPNSRLAVIGIANTMDLPERLLPRLKSRMGNSRLVYPPYTTTQLMEILELRLKTSEMAFEQSAKRLIAAKVAAVSGDVRRALDICRCATEIAEEEYGSFANTELVEMAENGPDSKRIRRPSAKRGGALNGKNSRMVTVAHVNTAVSKISGDSRLAVLKNLSAYERLLLIAILSLARSMGTFDIDSSSSLGAIFSECRSIANDQRSLFPYGPPNTDELQASVARLSSQRVILVERASKPLVSRVVVNLAPEDCSFALMDDPIANAALHGKSCLRTSKQK